MQSQLSLDRFLSFWTHAAEYTLSGELKSGQLATLIDGCINHFLPPALFQDSIILDLKGCGPQALLLENAPAPKYPEELLFLSGQYLPLSDQLSPAESNPNDLQSCAETFKLQLLTKFDQYLGDNHISHQLVTVRAGCELESLDWQMVQTTPGISFDHFRIGLEVFHDKLINWTYSPIGDQRLFLEADARRFKILLGAESLKDKTDLPLSKDGLLDRLAVVLDEIFKFDLKSDYLNLMRQGAS